MSRMAVIVAALFLICGVVSFGALAQAPYGGTGEQGKETPREQPSKAKELAKVFCPERSIAQRYMMVDATNCIDVCEHAYEEYPCELQQRLKDGWKVSSVSVKTLTVQKDPCECGLIGPESQLER